MSNSKQHQSITTASLHESPDGTWRQCVATEKCPYGFSKPEHKPILQLQGKAYSDGHSVRTVTQPLDGVFAITSSGSGSRPRFFKLDGNRLAGGELRSWRRQNRDTYGQLLDLGGRAPAQESAA